MEKQYEVVQVDPSKPIEKFDVLLAVQPSSLAQPQMFNLIEAIRAGQPTAIFEDPAPVFEAVPGTTEQKQRLRCRACRAAPKGDINELWSLLGVKYVSKDRGGPLGGMPPSDSVVWQDWNPYPKLCGHRANCRANSCSSAATSRAAKCRSTTNRRSLPACRKCGFPFPGAIEKLNSSKMKFVELVTTGDKTGTVPSDQIRSLFEDSRARMQVENDGTTREVYCLAAHITGDVKGQSVPPMPTSSEKADDKKDR